MPKIHLSFRHDAICGKGGSAPLLTTDIDRVTCKACRKHRAGELPPEEKKPVGRPPSPNGQNTVSGNLTDDAYAVYLAMEKGTRWATISKLLESLLSE